MQKKLIQAKTSWRRMSRRSIRWELIAIDQEKSSLCLRFIPTLGGMNESSF